MLPTYQVFRTVLLMRAVARREIDMVGLGPSIDLGRSLTDLLGFLTGLHDKGVDLFLHQQGIDTSTTSGKALASLRPRRCSTRTY